MDELLHLKTKALGQLTTGTDRKSRIESKKIFQSPSQRDQSLHAWLRFNMNNILSCLKKGVNSFVNFVEVSNCFHKKSKINTRVCGYTLDLTSLSVRRCSHIV